MRNSNSSFLIIGNQLFSNGIFNYEEKSSYSVIIRSESSSGEIIQEELIVTVNDINDIPTEIHLSVFNIDEKMPANTLVGYLSTDDEDLNDEYTYILLDETGNKYDNAYFYIDGNMLLTTKELIFEEQPTYTLVVKTTDKGGDTFQKNITIAVNDKTIGITDLSIATQKGWAYVKNDLLIIKNTQGPVHIYNVNGTRFLNQMLKGSTTVNISAYPSGMYFIKGENLTSKFIR